MRYPIWAVVGVACLFVGGCAAGGQRVVKAAQVISDPYRQSTTIDGQEVVANTGLLEMTSVKLVTVRDHKTGAQMDGAHISVSYQSPWRFFESAYDASGTKLTVLRVNRDVGYCGSYVGCALHEQIAVQFPAGHLDRFVLGISIKLYPQKGAAVTVNIPANAVAEQLRLSGRPVIGYGSVPALRRGTSQGRPAAP